MLKEIPHRPGDFVSRYGGEEFICVLPNTDFEGAMLLAEKIRQDVIQLSIPHLTSTVSNHLTVSIGVQTVDQITEQRTPEAVVVLCDEQLYAAKMEGKNRVCGHRISR